ncbi:hypothetical protein ACFE04_029916 [Oxalis oulophora]
MNFKILNHTNNDFQNQSDFQICNKHPIHQQTQIGICPYCLKDRLLTLICSDCGEQRLSSCSCSDHRTSTSAVEIGDVGRVSFLLENDGSKKVDIFDNHERNPNFSKNPNLNPNGVLLLNRSNSISSCVEIKRRNGFWRIGRNLFRKRNFSKFGAKTEKNDNNWVGVGDGGGCVSRSRSLCSFRGGGWWSEDGGDGDRMAFSGARSSISAARSSSVFDPERKSGFSEAEPRRSGFDSDQRRDSTASAGGVTRRVFSLKESYFTNGDDNGFIDLKFDFSSSSETKPEVSKVGGLLSSDTFLNSGFGSTRRSEIEYGGGLNGYGGGSCRFDNRGIKRSRKSFKGWRWIFQATSKHKEER